MQASGAADLIEGGHPTEATVAQILRKLRMTQLSRQFGVKKGETNANA